MADRPFAQFDEPTEREILDLVREARGQRRGGRRAPKRNYGAAGGGLVSAGEAPAVEVDCGLEIEVSTSGGLHWRIVSDVCTGPWVSIDAVLCNSAPLNAPLQTPS